MVTEVTQCRQDFQPPLPLLHEDQEATRTRWDNETRDISFPSSSSQEVTQQASPGRDSSQYPSPTQWLLCSPWVTPGSPESLMPSESYSLAPPLPNTRRVPALCRSQLRSRLRHSTLQPPDLPHDPCPSPSPLLTHHPQQFFIPKPPPWGSSCHPVPTPWFPLANGDRTTRSCLVGC